MRIRFRRPPSLSSVKKMQGYVKSNPSINLIFSLLGMTLALISVHYRFETMWFSCPNEFK